MDKKYYTIVLIIVVSLTLFLFTDKVSKSKMRSYLDDYDFSVGTVETYFGRGTIGHNVGVSSVRYSYVVNNIKYVKNYDALFYRLPPSPNINDKFVVAYNKNDPQKSLLLGDYPINSNEDFKAFVKGSKNFKIKF